MVVILTDENFEIEVLGSDLPVLVDFWAPWCPPCRMLSSVIEELSEDFSGRIKVGKLNVDEGVKTAQEYSIMSIPALRIFKDGQIVGEMNGLRPKGEIGNNLEDIVGGSQEEDSQEREKDV